MAPQKVSSVLCINDSDITLFVLKRLLSTSNFAENVTEKKDGRQALNYCRQFIGRDDYVDYPKVIFLDLHMPVMDGWEFLETFSSEIWPFFKETKVVITSQSVNNDDCTNASKYPFVFDFVKKPISLDYLINLHESLMEGFSVR